LSEELMLAIESDDGMFAAIDPRPYDPKPDCSGTRTKNTVERSESSECKVRTCFFTPLVVLHVYIMFKFLRPALLFRGRVSCETIH